MPRLCPGRTSEAYARLFDIEAFLRLTVRWELRGRNPHDWLGLLPQELVATARERLQQEQSVRYVDPRKASLLSYLNLSELKDVLLGAVWPAFKNQWPPEDIVRAEFRKLIAVRNKVAHFRPLTHRDVRVVQRFCEDLADWSRHYRRTREYATRLSHDCTPAQIAEFARGSPALGAYWERLVASGVAGALRARLGIAGHHVVAESHAAGGSLQSGPLLSLLDHHERWITFLRIGDLAEQACCFIPAKAPSAEIESTLEALWEATTKVGEGLSRDEVESRFELEGHESLLAWSVDIPTEFWSDA